VDDEEEGEVLVRAALLVIGLMLVFCPAATALNVTRITIDPSGTVTPGTPMVITGTLSFESSSGKTVESPYELRLSTDLEKASWNYTLVPDGKENPQPRTAGKILTISGWLLSSPDMPDASVRFSLTGIAPTMPQTQNITVVRIQETDGQGNPVPGTTYEYHTVVVNIGPSRPNPAIAALGVFRTHIDEKIAMGIDTSAAEDKYAEADAKIKSAKARPSSQYQLASADLMAAQKAIDDGERFLDKALAEKEVADAQERVDKADAIIGWFKANSSAADDPQLPAIITKREIAVSYLETARDDINKHNFEQARAKAKEAFQKANGSYNDALVRKDQQVSCWGCNSGDIKIPVTSLICTVAIILLIAGIFWWKKSPKE
jgi:hypothetical protein